MTDREIVSSILNRNPVITKEYLYKTCYPLFYSIYNKYYTDCNSVVELINDIYVYILHPNKDSGRCKLEDFAYRCTLTMWLKIVTENYCHQLYKKKLDCSGDLDIVSNSSKFVDDDMFEINVRSIHTNDIMNVLSMMTNERYRNIVIYRYLKGLSNTDTAEMLHMTMPNYYNKHKLAKAQFENILRREGLI